jgi:hypothetical protein
MDDGLSRDEQLILDWLLDRNDAQRNVRTTPAGKKVAEEVDVSGGLHALTLLLRSETPIHPRLRLALAEAIDPTGDSILQVKRRLRRRPGRPSKLDSIDGTVTYVGNVFLHGKRLAEARKALKKRRPQPAAMMKPKKVTVAETVQDLGISEPEHRRRVRDHKVLVLRKK